VSRLPAVQDVFVIREDNKGGVCYVGMSQCWRFHPVIVAVAISCRARYAPFPGPFTHFAANSSFEDGRARR
jgi:hypothetical protein